jgi:hypothetical protein
MLCLDDCITTAIITQPTEITQFIFGQPLSKRPNPHALSPAILAAVYLGIPADAELIRALMRGILTAISAKSVEPLGLDARQNFAVPGEVRRCPPILKRRYHALPMSATTATLRRGGKTNSVDNAAERERQGGTGDHRVLL